MDICSMWEFVEVVVNKFILIICFILFRFFDCKFFEVRDFGLFIKSVSLRLGWVLGVFSVYLFDLNEFCIFFSC